MKNDVSLHNCDTSAYDGHLGVQVDRSFYGKAWNYAVSALTYNMYRVAMSNILVR